MRTRRLLVCVAALGLFAGFSCAARSDEGTRTEAKAQSGNANAAGDEKKVSVSAGGDSVEVKSNDGKVSAGDGSVEVKSSDGNSVSAGDGSVAVKSADGKSVTISPGGIAVSGSEKVEVSTDDVVKIAGVNQNETYECKGRSFNVEGTSNTIRLTGRCQNLRVSGTTNRVDVETVAAINISGIRNQVTWEHGVNNKPPRIANSGINNTVTQKGN